MLDVADNLAIIDSGTILAAGRGSDLLSGPPSRRVAEILGIHSVIRGTLNPDGMFIAPAAKGRPISLKIPHPQAELKGCECFALIRHDGISIRNWSGSEDDESGTVGLVTDIVDRASTIRATIRISDECELISSTSDYRRFDQIGVGELVEVEFSQGAITLVAS